MRASSRASLAPLIRSNACWPLAGGQAELGLDGGEVGAAAGVVDRGVEDLAEAGEHRLALEDVVDRLGGELADGGGLSRR